MLADSPVTACVATADPKRAKAFYGDVLGLQLLDETDFALVFAAGGSELKVSIVNEVVPAHYAVLGWRVADIRRTVLQLRERGIACERFPNMKQDAFGVWTNPGRGKMAWFKDPDGNLLSLTEAPERPLR